MSVLTAADLVDCDLISRDHDGKTAADHIAERRLPIEDRVDLRESFDGLAVCASKKHWSNDISATKGQDKAKRWSTIDTSRAHTL